MPYIKDLESAVRSLKPTALIGVSTQAGAFTPKACHARRDAPILAFAHDVVTRAHTICAFLTSASCLIVPDSVDDGREQRPSHHLCAQQSDEQIGVHGTGGVRAHGLVRMGLLLGSVSHRLVVPFGRAKQRLRLTRDSTPSASTAGGASLRAGARSTPSRISAAAPSGRARRTTPTCFRRSGTAAFWRRRRTFRTSRSLLRRRRLRRSSRTRSWRKGRSSRPLRM